MVGITAFEAGKLALGAAGVFGQDKGPSIHEQYQAAEQHAYHLPKSKRAGYEAAGINPLLAFGGGGSTYSPALSSSGLSDSLANLTSTISDIEALRIQTSQLELEKQRLEKLNKDTTLKAPEGGIYQRNGTGRTTDNILDRADGRSGGSGPSAFAQSEEELTTPRRDVYNLYVDVYDPMTERWISVPNPDLMDAGPLESAYAMAQMGSADALQNYGKLGGVGGATAKRERVRRPRARPMQPTLKKPRRVANPF